MSRRRTPAATVATLLVAVAVSLLGVRLFLPGAALGCAAAETSCCCAGDPAEPAAPAGDDGCGCSVSPATPVPSAVLALVEGVAPPALAAEAESPFEAAAPRVASREPGPAPRARAAPTQALLETFRN